MIEQSLKLLDPYFSLLRLCKAQMSTFECGELEVYLRPPSYFSGYLLMGQYK
jgi:hypothetical protein